MKTAYRLFFLFSLLEGLAALGFLLRVPSEEGTGTILGYSPARLAVAAALLFAIVVFAALAWLAFRQETPPFFDLMDYWFAFPGRLLLTMGGLGLFASVCGLAYLFTYLTISPHLRGAIIWAGLVALQGVVLIAWVFRSRLREPAFWSPLRELPSWSRLDAYQRRTLVILLVIGLIYFLAFIVPNALGAHTPEELLVTSGDEYVTYPNVTLMLSPAENTTQAIYRWFIYEDYHYGYPFYFLTALALLPFRLVMGDAFAGQTQLHLLVMRQMINVLPLILAALLLTWMQTRFRSKWRATGLFLFLLLIPPVVRYNIQFWHPDALVVLFVTLTLFFLDRDQFRFGANFNLAALFCGLAAATKLYGFFFFLAVGGYLFAGLVKGCLTWSAAVRRGLLFMTIMGLTIVLSNPWLSDANARARFGMIFSDKSHEMTYGYGETSPDAIEFYRRGLVPTLDFIIPRYGSLAFLLFGTLSFVAAALRGPRRTTAWLILAWFIPMSVYFIWGMNYKSFHYWMPAMLPFLSGVTGLLDAADGEPKTRRVVVQGIVAAAMLAQVMAFIFLSLPEWQQWLRLAEI
jgi:hypothetical protein